MLTSDSACADFSIWPDVVPVSPAPLATRSMLSATSRVPLAAASTPLAMLWVAAPCCSTAEEIDVVISLMRSIVSPIALFALTDSPVARCMLTMCELISSVAFAVWPARVLTSCATTANPRPASPARAASMVALRASRLVCSAIDVISFTTSPIRSPAADDSADLGAEVLDKLTAFRLALLHRQLLGIDAFGLELAALDAVVQENADGAGDRADFVVAIGVPNFDVRPAFGENRQGCRHGLQRFGDAADNQHCHPEHEQSGNGRCNRHGRKRLPQHAVELSRRNADIDDADHLAVGAEHWLIRRVETISEQHRRAFVGLAAADDGLPGMIRSKLRADRPVAIFFFHIGGSADKLLRRVVVHEQRGVAADIGGCPIDDLVIAEFGHLRNLNTLDHAVANGDLRVREGFAEGETERAQVGVDIAQGARVEVARQRPVARPHHQRGVHRDQESCAQDRLRPEVKSQKSKALSSKSKRHAELSRKSVLIVETCFYDSLYDQLGDRRLRITKRGCPLPWYLEMDKQQQ